MTTYDDVAICNMALDRVDIGTPISDIAADSDEARVCNRWYAKCRDKVLNLQRCWPFSKRSIALGLVEEAPDDAARWGFSYRYPINCLHVLRIENGLRLDTHKIEWEVGSDDTGRLIFTDEADAVVEYVHIFTDPGEWPDLFADAVSALLASEIAGPLGRGADTAGRNRSLFMSIKASAMAKAQSEGFLRRPVCSYISARGGVDDRRDSTGRRS